MKRTPLAFLALAILAAPRLWALDMNISGGVYRNVQISDVYGDTIACHSDDGNFSVRRSEASPKLLAILNVWQNVKGMQAAREAQAREAEEAKAAAKPPIPPLYCSLQLAAAYLNNEVAADQQFKGTKIRLQGIVKAIKKNSDHDAVVTIQGYDRIDIECIFDADTSPGLADLSPEDVVRLVGTPRGKKYGDVLVTGCLLKKLFPNGSPQNKSFRAEIAKLLTP